MSRYLVSETRTIRADAQRLFDIVADPAKHPLIDGSGSVKAIRDGGPDRLSLGAKFGMDMHLGADYKVLNTVVEFEEGRQIGWRHFNGHIWRYLFTPVDGGTEVTEQWDARPAKRKLGLLLLGFDRRNRKGIVKTLQRLDEVATEPTALHTEHWGGDGSAGRALLLPGITSSAATMWQVGEGLAAQGWSATAVDLPGHGGSGPAESYRFADLAETLATQFGTGWDLVVAHSLGGAITTVLLAAHPDFAKRALLIDPALSVGTEVADSLAPGLRRDQAAGLTEADIAADNPHWHARTVTERLRSMRSADADAIGRYPADNRPWDVRAQAREVRVPVHVLVPDSDPTLAPDLVAELRETTTWTFETVPDATHSVHRDQPALAVDRAANAPITQ